MSSPALRPEIAEYYTSGFDESARLRSDAAGRLEYERTRELLTRLLPPAPATVLDVGGGPGVHASWLAEAGYRVTLIDPVPLHREQAARHGGFEVCDGDARALTGHGDGAYDAVLMLGPLYHLVQRAERVRALSEARRVARTGGPVAAATISRHAPLLDVAARGRLDDVLEPRILADLGTGVHDSVIGFTTAYFHTVDEVRTEFIAAGLAAPTVYGIEGPLCPLIASGLAEDRPDLFATAMRAARLAETDGALLASSAHMLTVAIA